jgi:hypothetical protein
MITPAKISSSVKGLNLEGSMSSSKGCSSIYCFIWVSLSVKKTSALRLTATLTQGSPNCIFRLDSLSGFK